MLAAQILINALVLGCLYACIAIGFSLVVELLNINARKEPATPPGPPAAPH